MRRVTSSGRDQPVNFEVAIRDFLAACGSFRLPAFIRKALANMDQTSIYLDPELTRTYAEAGSRRVEAVTAGQQRTRISVALTASADGDKAPCLCLIPRKKPLKDFTCPANIVVVYGTNGCFNSNVMVENYMPLF